MSQVRTKLELIYVVVQASEAEDQTKCHAIGQAYVQLWTVVGS